MQENTKTSTTLWQTSKIVAASNTILWGPRSWVIKEACKTLGKNVTDKKRNIEISISLQNLGQHTRLYKILLTTVSILALLKKAPKSSFEEAKCLVQRICGTGGTCHITKWLFHFCVKQKYLCHTNESTSSIWNFNFSLPFSGNPF